MATVVGLSRAEDVAHRASRGVADNHQASREQAIAEAAVFTVVLAQILDLDGDAIEDGGCVFGVQPSFGERRFALGGVVGDAHAVSASTQTSAGNATAGGRGFWRVAFALGRRCIAERSKHGVDASLIARTLCLEPLDDVLIDPKRDQFFGRNGLEATAHNAADHVLRIELGMFGAGLALLR